MAASTSAANRAPVVITPHAVLTEQMGGKIAKPDVKQLMQRATAGQDTSVRVSK